MRLSTGWGMLRLPDHRPGMLGLACAVALLGAASEADARKLALVALQGPGAQAVQRTLAKGLSRGHTVITPVEIAAVAQRLGLSGGCKPAELPRLATTLGAEAVICGTVAGRRARRKLTLTLYGADAKVLLSTTVALVRGKLTKRRVGRLVPKLEQALDQAAAAAAPTPAPAASVDPLQDATKRLASPVAADRVAALGSLSRIPDWRALQPMSCSLLNDKAMAVRSAAASHLGTVNDLSALTAMRAAAVLETNAGLRQRLRSVLKGLRQRVSGLVAQLRDPDAARRAAAAKALSAGVYPQALAPLVQALVDPDVRVRRNAVEGLRYFAEPAARAGLRSASRDNDPSVRQRASTYEQEHQRLGAWRAFYRSYMRIIKKTEAAAAPQRSEAVIALGISLASNADKRMAAMVLQDADEQVRIDTAWSLVLLGKKRGDAALRIAADNDASENVRQVIKSYMAINSANLKDLLAKLRSEVPQLRRRAAAALSLRPKRDVLPHLVRASLCDADEGVRSAALRGLARANDPLALTTVKLVMFRDSSAVVRQSAMMLYVLVGWQDVPGRRVAAKRPAKAAKDTEDPEYKEKLRRAKEQARKKELAKPVEPSCPLGCRALQAQVGASSLFIRNYGVTEPANAIDSEGITTTPVAGFALGAEVFPATWFTKNWLANFGVGLSYARYFGLRWHTTNNPDEDFDASHEVLTVDFLKVRWQPVRSERVPTLYGRFGLHYLGFSMNDEAQNEAHIPDLSATSLSVGLAARIPIRSLHLLIGADYLPGLSFGEVTEDSEFGDGDGWGVLGTVGLGGPITKMLGWRADLTYTLYMLEFKRVSGVALRLADGVTDMYFHGRFSLTFNL